VSELSDAELERYARQIVLHEIGGIGQRRLKSASVAVVGAGGIGSAAIPALAGAGIGRLTVIDDDAVDASNLHRQLIFRTDQVGQPKAPLAASFAKALNPFVSARGAEVRLGASNAEELLTGHDLILDGSDNFATRLVVSDTATRLRIPLVSAAAAQFQAQVALFRGWETDQPCYRCFVGDAFDADDCDNCAEVGVIGALTAMAGGFAALMAIQELAGVGAPAGTLHLYQGAAASWRQIRVPKDPQCNACGGANASNP
jgi:adenylyltransferase/sulfurtransferase